MSRGFAVKYEEGKEIYDWCVEQFGNDNDHRWYIDIQPLYDPEIIFIEERDAVLFALRWGLK